MIVLGLGSNIGDRLKYLRQAFQLLKSIPTISVQQVSPLYMSDALVPENAPADWHKPFINLAVRITTTLSPHELLAAVKKIESTLGRPTDAPHWSPRPVDIDILIWDDLVLQDDTLTIPHAQLLKRPFALWPLADVAPFWCQNANEIIESLGSRFSGEAAFHTRQIQQRIDTPQLLGTVNVTPNSFSDGGKFLNPDIAIQHAIALVEAGADVIDIGAESTAPHADAPVDTQTEWQRLAPVILGIKAASRSFLVPPIISIDTRHADVAAKALNAGADWINDVTGLQDPKMREIVAASSADCVVMHHLSIPPTRTNILPADQDAVKLIYGWGVQHLDLLEKSGISLDRVIFDPGIGFGKADQRYIDIIKHAAVFKQLGTRVLIGHSRKSFLGLFTPNKAADRDTETQVISLALAKQGVDYLRVHNVDMCARGFKVTAALQG